MPRCRPAFGDPAAFSARVARIGISSAKTAPALAACFRGRAPLLPGSTLLADADGLGATYALRLAGHSFEEIRFRPADGGSAATVLTAPDAERTFTAAFERERLGPLKRCA